VAASGGKCLSGLPAMAGRGHPVCPECRFVSGDLPDPGFGAVDSIILTTSPKSEVGDRHGILSGLLHPMSLLRKVELTNYSVWLVECVGFLIPPLRLETTVRTVAFGRIHNIGQGILKWLDIALMNVGFRHQLFQSLGRAV